MGQSTPADPDQRVCCRASGIIQVESKFAATTRAEQRSNLNLVSLLLNQMVWIRTCCEFAVVMNSLLLWIRSSKIRWSEFTVVLKSLLFWSRCCSKFAVVLNSLIKNHLVRFRACHEFAVVLNSLLFWIRLSKINWSEFALVLNSLLF